MKKIIYFVVFLYAISLHAISPKLDSIFMKLDHTQMHTKYLWDKQIRIYDPLLFDGSTSNDQYINLSALKIVSDQFSYSNVTDTSDFLSITEIDSLYEQLKFADTLTIAMLFAEYDKFVDSADTKGYVYWQNEQLFDSSGRVTNPYEVHDCYINAISKDTVIVDDSTYSLPFIIPSSLVQTNKTIDSVLIDFGDGNGYNLVGYNTVYIKNYNELGNIDIGIKTFSDTNTFINTHSIYTKTNDIMLMQGTAPASDFSFDVNNPYNSSATAYVWLSCPEENTIKRPFVIVEGFDALNKLEDYEYEELLNKYANGIHSTLLQKGYDVILLDFDEGGGDIINNAKNLEYLLDILNNDNSVNGYSINLKTNIRVMGISMGGVVSRYCLADMEQRNKPHNVNLWFTVDSPHQGANIPFGIRNQIYFNDNQLKWLFNILDVLGEDTKKEHIESLKQVDSEAAKQMLFPHYSLDFYYKNNDTEFNSFYNSMQAKGFPAIYNTFAFTNGSLSGNNQKNHSPYTPDLYFEAYTRYFNYNKTLKILPLPDAFDWANGKLKQGFVLYSFPDKTFQTDDYLYAYYLSKVQIRVLFWDITVAGLSTPHKLV